MLFSLRCHPAIGLRHISEERQVINAAGHDRREESFAAHYLHHSQIHDFCQQHHINRVKRHVQQYRSAGFSRIATDLTR